MACFGTFFRPLCAQWSKFRPIFNPEYNFYSVIINGIMPTVSFFTTTHIVMSVSKT